jgi:hypothetical protein
LLPVPAAAVCRHDAVTEDDADGVDRADDRDPVVGVRGGDRVVVGVKPDQRQRVGVAVLDPGGHERLAGQGDQLGALLLQQDRLDRGLAPEPPPEIRAAACFEVGVERLQAAVHGGDRDQKVAAGVPDQGLDVPLLVGPPHQAEVRFEQVMTFQSEELSGDLSLPAAGDPGDGDLGVVVADPPRDAAEEGKGAGVALEERLGALAGEGADEGRVGVRQRHDEQGHRGGPAVEGDLGCAESPGRWANGTNTAARPRRQARTASLTTVNPPW